MGRISRTILTDRQMEDVNMQMPGSARIFKDCATGTEGYDGVENKYSRRQLSAVP